MLFRYIVSDYDSIQVLFAAQNYTTLEDGVSDVLRSGWSKNIQTKIIIMGNVAMF